VLGAETEANVVADPRSFVLPDGRLDFALLLREFAEFWVEHGDLLTTDVVYHEVAPQLVLMGHLHRVVNGGGYTGREYGVGRGRIDLLVRWPYSDTAGKRCWQREALELEMLRNERPTRSPRAWPSSTATSTGSASTPAYSSSSTGGPRPPRSPNAPNSRRPPARPAARSPSRAPEGGFHSLAPTTFSPTRWYDGRASASGVGRCHSARPSQPRARPGSRVPVNCHAHS
jgi:hypothetical protein